MTKLTLKNIAMGTGIAAVGILGMIGVIGTLADVYEAGGVISRTQNSQTNKPTEFHYRMASGSASDGTIMFEGLTNFPDLNQRINNYSGEQQ